MKDLKFWQLIHKRLSDQITPAEHDLLKEKLAESEVNARMFRQTEKIWSRSEEVSSDFKPDVAAGLQRLKSKIAQQPQAANIKQLPSRNRAWLQIAASLLALIVVSWLAWSVIGGATADPVMQTAMSGDTSRELLLSDGSKIMMNGDSRIDFPEQMSATERRINLSGEAFFEVDAQPDRPFLIDMDQAQVKVVGTAFNLRSYPEEPFIELTVTHGKVIFRSIDTNDKWELGKDEVLFFDRNTGSAEKKTDRLHNARAWQLNRLNFDETPLHEVVSQLQRYKGFNIHIDETELQNCPFDVDFSDESAADIAEVIATALGARLQKTDNTYRLLGGKCPESN